MAEEQQGQQEERQEQQDGQQAQQEPQERHDEGDGVESEVERWKRESRKWESRAKANKDAADELERRKEAEKTELQKLSDRAEKAEREAAELRHVQEVAGWRRQVSDETGVDADILRGDTLEELQEHAEAIKRSLASRDRYPHVEQGKASGKELTKAQIREIKDKSERLSAYAEYHRNNKE